MQLRNKKESELQSWKENSVDESVCGGIKRMLADFVSLQMFFTHGFIGCLFSRFLVVTRNEKWCHERDYPDRSLQTPYTVVYDRISPYISVAVYEEIRSAYARIRPYFFRIRS